MRKRIVSSLLVSFVVVFASVSIPTTQAQQSEALGQAAEQAGKYREALNYYVSALQSAAEGSVSDQALREKIIAVVQKLSPPPAIPDEARRSAVRGQIAVREAKSQADYIEAASEFRKALRLAPWWADSYINLAVAQERAGQFNEAVQSLKLYLLAAPNARDADKVKDQIYALEYRQERSRKDAQDRDDEARRQEIAKREAEERTRREADERRRQAAQAAEQEKLRGRQIFASMAGGRWNVSDCPNGNTGIAEFRMVGSGQLERRDWINQDRLWTGWSWSDWQSFYYSYDETAGRIMKYGKLNDRLPGTLRVVSENDLHPDPVGSTCRLTR